MKLIINDGSKDVGNDDVDGDDDCCILAASVRSLSPCPPLSMSSFVLLLLYSVDVSVYNSNERIYDCYAPAHQ